MAQEVKFGKLLPSHPNLPVFVGSCASEDGPWVVWERIHGAGLDALSSTLAASGGLPKEAQILSWSQQLYSALACLHSVGECFPPSAMPVGTRYCHATCAHGASRWQG